MQNDVVFVSVFFHLAFGSWWFSGGRGGRGERGVGQVIRLNRKPCGEAGGWSVVIRDSGWVPGVVSAQGWLGGTGGAG